MIDEQIKIYNEDCISGFKNIENKSIDLIITDPPYTMTKRGKSCRPNYMPDNMGDNVFDGQIPDVYDWMSECYRVLKDDTHFYTFCNTNDIMNYLVAADKIGFKLHNIITMIKDTKMPNRWYLKFCELILFFRKGNAKPINDMTSRDYIMVEMPKKDNGKLHITQKPIDIIEKLITNSSKENDIVLDPFLGSGTTMAACMNTNRRGTGFEIDEKYFNIIKTRLSEIENNKENNTNVEQLF